MSPLISKLFPNMSLSLTLVPTLRGVMKWTIMCTAALERNELSSQEYKAFMPMLIIQRSGLKSRCCLSRGRGWVWILSMPKLQVCGWALRGQVVKDTAITCAFCGSGPVALPCGIFLIFTSGLKILRCTILMNSIDLKVPLKSASPHLPQLFISLYYLTMSYIIHSDNSFIPHPVYPASSPPPYKFSLYFSVLILFYNLQSLTRPDLMGRGMVLFTGTWETHLFSISTPLKNQSSSPSSL